MNVIIIGEVCDCIWWWLYSSSEQVGDLWRGWIYDYVNMLCIFILDQFYASLTICRIYSHLCLFCCGICAPQKYIYLVRGVAAFDLEDEVEAYFVSLSFSGLLVELIWYVTLRKNYSIYVTFSFGMFCISSLSFGVGTFVSNFMLLFCCINIRYILLKIMFGETSVILYMLNYFIKCWVGN